MPPHLWLRPLRLEDEGPARAAHEELGDYNVFVDYRGHEPWGDLVDRMQRQRRATERR